MYDKTTIHGIIFCLCILAYLVSPKADLSIHVQEVQASQASQTGKIREVPRTQTIDETVTLSKLHEKVCKKQINSPLCKDYELFERLYHITEERLPNKQFYPIMLGILNSESSLGTNFYPSGCSYTNNLAGKKWKKTDDGESVRDQKIPDKNGCWLYSFESIEDFWISYTNTFRYGYPGCIDSKTPLACIAPMYVKGDGKPKPQWVKNASLFID